MTPFFLELPVDCVGNDAMIINGEERIDVACRRAGDTFRLEFPVYDTRIEAQAEPDGRFLGQWIRRLPGQSVVVSSFEADPVPDADPLTRFQVNSSDDDPVVSRPSLSGVWRVEFESRGLGKGTFGQTSSGIVRGSIEVVTEYGDMRFLAGNLMGTELRLSTFDGQYAYLVTADVTEDGMRMEGELVTSAGDREPFVAERTGDFELADPIGRVQATAPDGRIDLEPLSDPAYAGQPVIVEIFGTWCPNCHDLTPVLQELYRMYQTEGLEIVSVAYEATDNREYNQQRIEAYREKHQVPWETVLAEGTVESLVTEGIAGLSPIVGVPVTVFINPDGTVHAVYTGFSGPATGAAYQRATTVFRTLTTEILQSE